VTGRNDGGEGVSESGPLSSGDLVNLDPWQMTEISAGRPARERKETFLLKPWQKEATRGLSLVSGDPAIESDRGESQKRFAQDRCGQKGNFS